MFYSYGCGRICVCVYMCVCEWVGVGVAGCVGECGWALVWMCEGSTRPLFHVSLYKCFGVSAHAPFLFICSWRLSLDGSSPRVGQSRP